MSRRTSALLSTLANSQLQKKDNAAYQTIFELIKGLENAEGTLDAAVANINNIINGGIASNTVEDLDGTNDPGLSNEFSRGDHKHDYGVNSIEYNRIQQVSDESKLLGRGEGGGAGDVEEIELGDNLEMVGTTLNAITSSDHVVMSDGNNPPSPMDDGNGNFMYFNYTP